MARFEHTNTEVLHALAAGRLVAAGGSVLHSLDVLVNVYENDMSPEARDRLREARNVLSVALTDAEAAMSEHRRRVDAMERELLESRRASNR